MAKTGKRELKVILNITLVELTGQRSNCFEQDLKKIVDPENENRTLKAVSE